jgi:hypothetical protein
MKSILSVLAACALMGGGLAQAQEEPGHGGGNGAGHEKCIGDGHDRDAACRGRIGSIEAIVGDQTYCDKQFAQDVESSWRRYACDLSTDSTAYGDVVLVYAEDTSENILNYADGALGLVPPPPVPQPQVVPPDYLADLSKYVEIASQSVMDYADGALGLVPPPPVPQPQVVPQEYIRQVSFYAEATSQNVLNYANGALGLVPPPPVPQPQVIPSPERILGGG